MSSLNKPELYLSRDQADAAAASFLDAIVRMWVVKIPDAYVNSRKFEAGSIGFVWGHGGVRLLATALVVTSATGWLLTTREYQEPITRSSPPP